MVELALLAEGMGDTEWRDYCLCGIGVFVGFCSCLIKRFSGFTRLSTVIRIA